jgi:hypothetical protein
MQNSRNITRLIACIHAHAHILHATCTNSMYNSPPDIIYTYVWQAMQRTFSYHAYRHAQIILQLDRAKSLYKWAISGRYALQCCCKLNARIHNTSCNIRSYMICIGSLGGQSLNRICNVSITPSVVNTTSIARVHMYSPPERSEGACPYTWLQHHNEGSLAGADRF